MEEKKFCKFCGEKIDKSSIVCPKCGRQLQILKKSEQKIQDDSLSKKENQSKFYEQQWFMWIMLIFFAPVGILLMWKFNKNLKYKTKIILSIVCGIIFLITMFNGNGENKKIVWEDIELNDKLPKPESLHGEVITNNVDRLRFDITRITKKEYKQYVEKCRDKGYIIDLKYDPWDNFYDAFDKNGYSLSIFYSDYSEEMSITLESPKQNDMKEIEWPTSGLGAMLPKPISTFGDIISNNSETFSIYIGNMTISDYNDYVKNCENAGYTIDFSKDEKNYSATNSKGYKLSLLYLGANVIEISLDKPEEENLNIDDKNNSSNEELSYDFKKAMDDYEKFMNEYISFMKKYKDSNGTDTSLLKDYTKYLAKYSEMISSFEKWQNKELNNNETNYYLEVQTRVNKKLLEVSID